MFKQIQVRLDDLYLDPNNPRCVTTLHLGARVSDERIGDYQAELLAAFDETGESEFFSIKDLLDSFREIGYQPIDKIVVRPLSGSKLLVLEGNRRVSALKLLKKRHLDGDESLLDLVTNTAVLPAMELETTGVAPDELAHRTAVLLGIRHHGSLLEWDPLPKACNTYKTYMGLGSLHDQFRLDGARLNKVASMLSIRRSEVRDNLRTYIAFRQLRERVEGVRDHHFSLIEAAVRNKNLTAHRVIEIGDETFRLSETAIHNIERLCQFSTRDVLPTEKKILPKPQSVAKLGRLKDKAESADSDPVRALARRLFAEATSGDTDPESGALLMSVDDALNSVIDFETRTKWLENLKGLMRQANDELRVEDFRRSGNDLMSLENARSAIRPLRAMLGV